MSRPSSRRLPDLSLETDRLETVSAAVTPMNDPHDDLPERTLVKALSYADSLGLETYDPFDTKGSPVILWSFKKRSLFRALVRKAVYGFELFAPFALRRLLKIKKVATAGGVGRLAQAHIATHKLDGGVSHLEKAGTLLKWLLEHPGDAPHGLGWGVPFAWSTFFGDVPAGTAVSHTTQACGHAFLDYFDVTGEKWALEAAHGCCVFLTQSLKQVPRPSGNVALSYTPFDASQVINISAESAAFLRRAGRPEDQELVSRLAGFVVECQAEDGSFPYSAQDSVEGENPIDHYHTGMVLNGLLVLSDDPGCRDAFERGVKFHLENHFLDNGCPKMRPSATYPVDAYSAGESLLLFGAVLRRKDVGDELSQAVFERMIGLVGFVLHFMSYPDGGFVYRMYKGRNLRLNSLRWAQALLCHGLAEYLLVEQELVARVAGQP